MVLSGIDIRCLMRGIVYFYMAIKSLEEYLAKKALLESELDQERLRLIESVVDEIRECISIFGISREDIFPSKEKTKNPRRAKYFDPVTGKTWAGVGKEPRWIRGRDRKEFELGSCKDDDTQP